MNEPHKILIITGSAACVLDDIRNIGNIGDTMQHHVPNILVVPNIQADFMAIGLDAVDKYAWLIEYVATYHPEKIDATRERRASIGGNTDYKLICHEERPGVDIVIKDWWKPSGSSALLGAQAALSVLGYKRIILCGCPLEGANQQGSSYVGFRGGWEKRKVELGDHVRSMSGWTREFLGRPTDEWLKGVS